MLSPICCFTCSMPLGDVYEPFKNMSDKVRSDALKKSGTCIEFALSNIDLDYDLVEIFEQLHIVSICCRMHINNSLNFMDEFYRD